MKIPCTNFYHQDCLTLGLGWNLDPWVSTGKGVSEIGVITKYRLHYTKHGPLWVDKGGKFFRIYNYTGPVSTTIDSQGYWFSTHLKARLTAESRDYQELLLEDLFS